MSCQGDQPSTWANTRASSQIEPLSDALAGRRILLPVSRRAEDLAAALERHGAETFIVEPMRTINHVDDATLLHNTRQLIADPPQTVAITTAMGFRGWLEAAEVAGVAKELLAALRASRIYARGPKAAGAIVRAGLEVAWTAARETAEEMIEQIRRDIVRQAITSDRSTMRPLLAVQHHGEVDARFAQELDGLADVCELTVYTWASAPDPQALRQSTFDVAAGAYDAVLFTSAPGARAWLNAAREVSEENFADLMARCTGEVKPGPLIAAVGPVTAKPLEEVGLHPLLPKRMRLGALAKAVTRELTAGYV